MSQRNNSEPVIHHPLECGSSLANSAAPLWNAFDPAAEIEFSQRKLPHWFQPGVVTFLTFRTCDSLPREAIEAWQRAQLDWLVRRGIVIAADVLRDLGSRITVRLPAPVRAEFLKLRNRIWHQVLDRGYGECLLRDSAIATMVADSIRHFEGIRYDVDSFVIMPNHVHVLFQCRPEWTVREIAQSWLHFTACRINRHLGRSGHFWQSEPFDHLVRSAEQFHYLQRYIRDNPLVARLPIGEYLYWQRTDARS